MTTKSKKVTQKLVKTVSAKEARYVIVERIHMPATMRYVRRESATGRCR